MIFTYKHIEEMLKPCFDTERIREIRENESIKRDVKARENIERLKQERYERDIPEPDKPLVCKKMKHLPPAEVQPDV